MSRIIDTWVVPNPPEIARNWPPHLAHVFKVFRREHMLAGTTVEEFIESMDDDFNTARALSVVFKVVHLVNATKASSYQQLLQEFVDVLGVKAERKVDDIPPDIVKLAAERFAAKQAKDWKRSDELRDAIKL